MNDFQPDEDFLRTLTVLYVEDDDETREQLTQILHRRVGRLLTAENGLAGLEAFQSGSVRMVITDIQMPAMDGLSMAQEIRKLDPDVPIIVTTAFEMTEYLLRSIDIGVDKYVTKPIVPERLHAAMQQLSRHLQADELAARRAAHLEEFQRLQVLGGMAAGIAHDFNNLLQVILGNVENVVANGLPHTDNYRSLHRALAACESAKGLGEVLLHMANIKAYHDSRKSIASLVYRSVQDALVDSQVILERHLPDSLPDVAFNSEQMRIVFNQLARNARTAMPAGGTLHISGEPCAVFEGNALALAPGNYVRITLRDTGSGILASHLPKVFYPYWSTQPMGSQKGLGLGLTVCYSLLRGHGGLIEAESIPGHGASFHVYLPVASRHGDTLN